MRYYQINEALPSVPPLAEVAATIFAYKTGKGSIYTVHPDGTTSRYKTYRPEHGATEVGDQTRSQYTFYAQSYEELRKLDLVQARGPDRIGVAPYKGMLACRYLTGPNAGKYIADTLVKVDRVPAVGKFPIEIWRDGQVVHFGNVITDVATKPIG